MREHLRALIAISIHALLTESDRFPVIGTDPSAIFQSTLSSRRATPDTLSSSRVEKKFQSTLSSRRATGRFRSVPLEGRYFNPRSPHGERPPVRSPRPTATPNFNPRSPHGERLPRPIPTAAPSDFNPRSPHGERQRPLFRRKVFQGISIHALLTESDTRSGYCCGTSIVISIHALLTESDYCQLPDGFFQGISIHALLTESDDYRPGRGIPGQYFNPRSPHGERRSGQASGIQEGIISIHALLTESDLTDSGPV